MDVFVSHSWSDKHLSEAVLRALRGAGLKVKSAESFQPGEDWGSRIRDEIEQSTCVIAVWSGREIDPNIAFEIGLATALNKPVYLFVSDDAVDQLPSDFGWARPNVRRFPAENLSAHAQRIAEELSEPA